MNPIDLQAFSYDRREALLPRLIQLLTGSGAWILDRHTSNPHTPDPQPPVSSSTELRLELPRHRIADLYASFAASGLDLTRASHQCLTHLCNCTRPPSRLPPILTLGVEITFLTEVTLHALLSTTLTFA